MADAVFDFGNGDRLAVKNVQVGSLGASDFILAPTRPHDHRTSGIDQPGTGRQRLLMPAVGETWAPSSCSTGRR